MAILKSTNIFGTLKIHALTQSTSSTTGSLVVSGGVGIGKDVSIAGNIIGVKNITTTGSINGLTITPVSAKTLNMVNASLTVGTATTNTGTVKIQSGGTSDTIITGPNNGTAVLVNGTMVPTARTITINSNNGITGGSATASDLSNNRSWTLGLTGQAKAFHDLNTNGIVTRTSSDTVSARTITGTNNRITISNGNGVSGNPTIDIASNYVGQNTITTVGTISGSSAKWQGTTVAVAYGGTGSTTVSANTILKGNSTSNAIVDSNITDNGTTITLGKDTVISGNLTVNGTTTTVNTTDLYIGDNIITLNSDLPGTTDPTQNAGIEINRGKSTNVSFLWDESVDKWTVGAGTIVASQFEGGLTGNVTGDVTGKVNGLTIDSTTGTLDIANGKTFTVNKTITLSASNDTSTLNIGTGGTLGTGAFAAAYVHPSDGGGSIPTALTGANVVSAITVNSLGHVTGTSTRALTPGDIGAEPAHSHPYLSNSSTSTQSGYFGDIYLRDDTDSSHYLQITNAENLTANRTLSISVGNASRTLTVAGNASISGTITIADGKTFEIKTGSVTFTGQSTGSSVTLPSSGTLSTLAGSETFTNKTLTSPIINDIKSSAVNTNADLWSEITTGSIKTGVGLTSGLLTIGGVSQTGSITIGNSTKSQILNLATGATESTLNKVINIGTNGTQNSNTYININAELAGANGITYINDLLYAKGVFGSGASVGITESGAGTKMLWYPRKAAFRAGKIDGTQWDNANIGSYSTAFGDNTKASGSYSVAIGSSAEATGSYSIAMGRLMQVSGVNSFGIGLGSSATSLSQSNTMAIMGGKVGIGTTTPTVELEVDGSLEVTGTITGTSFNSITGLASSAPSDLAATATKGISTLAAREDHVHKFPTLTELGIGNWVGTTKITTLGTITTGTWSAETIDVDKGGTGATTHTANALLKGDGAFSIKASNISDTGALITLGIASKVTGNLEVTGTITESSDRRLKTEINNISNALDKVKTLTGCTFKKANSDKVSMGLIAQDTQKVIPEVVNEGSDGYLGIQYSNIVALLIEAIKEQQEQINYLKSKVDKKKWWKIF